MKGCIHTLKYKNLYNQKVIKMIEDYTITMGLNSFLQIEIEEKSGVKYVSIEDYTLVYSDDWFVIKKDYGDFVEVVALYVLPDSRRNGVASNILNTLLRSYSRVFCLISPDAKYGIRLLNHLKAKENISHYANFKEYVLSK